MTHGELRPLTSVRGLFAWVVVLYHIRLSCADWLPAEAMRALGRGYVGVDFFFVLSGFVIWMTYGERLPGGGWRAARAFLVARVTRIWPLHLAMLGLCLAIAALLVASGRPPPSNYAIETLPLHLLLVQAWGFHDPLEWNDPAWSISAELAVYLLTPLAAALLPRRGRPAPWPVLALAVVLPLLALHVVLGAMGSQTLLGRLTQTGIVRCLLEFPAGAALAVVWRRYRGAAGLRAAAWVSAVAAFLAYLGGVSETLAIPFVAAALVLALALAPGAGSRGGVVERAAHEIGLASYATYLAHMPLWTAYKLAFVRDGDHVGLPVAAGFLACVLVASIALYHGLERPAQHWLRARWTVAGRVPVSPLRST